MQHSKLVVVQSFGTRAAADIALGILESSGIEAMIQADTAGGMRQHLAWSGLGFRVLVCEEDVAIARDVLKPPSDTDHVVVRTFATQDEADCAQGTLLSAGIPATIQDDSAGGWRPDVPWTGSGFAYSYTKKTWRQHATCLTGPTKRAPRPSDKSNWTLVQFQPYQARVELFDFSIRNVVHEKPILAIGRPGRCDPIWGEYFHLSVGSIRVLGARHSVAPFLSVLDVPRDHRTELERQSVGIFHWNFRSRALGLHQYLRHHLLLQWTPTA